MPDRLRLALLFLLALGQFGRPAVGDEQKTIALAIEMPAEMTGEERKLAADLLAVYKAAIEAEKRFSIVDWPTVPGAPDPWPPNWCGGVFRPPAKPQKANLLLTLELLRAVDRPQPFWARLRISDAKENALRGATVAGLDEATVEDAARQFSQYLSIAGWERPRPAVTVAVVPFENPSRSDRLRPLEIGLRDLVTTQLLALSGATAAGGLMLKDQDGGSQHPAPRGTFQVLRRESQDQLLAELDLVGATAERGDPPPGELPSRAAAYVIRGQIEEQGAGAAAQIVVRGALVQVASGQVVKEFTLKCSAAALDDRLASAIDSLGEALATHAGMPRSEPIATRNEVEALRNLVMMDLMRVEAQQHTISGHSVFRVTRKHAPAPPPPKVDHRRVGIGARSVAYSDRSAFYMLIHCGVGYDTPAGLHLLSKSVDRLETILFITPDDPLATLALGYCRSLVMPGTYHPARADELLRRAFALREDAGAILDKSWVPAQREEFGKAALDYLAHVGYDGATLEFDPAERPRAAERLEFALDHWVENGQFYRVLLLQQLGRLLDQTDENGWQGAFLERVDQLAIHAVEPELPKPTPGTPPPAPQRIAARRACLALINQMAHKSQNQPAIHAQTLEVLARWAASDDDELSELGRLGLGNTSMAAEERIKVGELYEQAAAKITDLSTVVNRWQHALKLVRASEIYRLANEPQRGLELLLPLVVDPAPQNLAAGYWGYEIGACYEALDRPGEALAAYLRATEECPGVLPNRDILQRIATLGGVPLRPDRAIDVEYFQFATAPAPPRRTVLATDGTRIYLGDHTGVHAFDVARRDWTAMDQSPTWVTCLVFADKKLWAGTEQTGLWRYDLASDQWTQPVAQAALPQGQIRSLAVAGDKAYVGIGEGDKGELLEVDGAGKIRQMAGKHGPNLVPTHLVATKTTLWARTANGIYEWSFDAGDWRPRPPTNPPTRASGIFSGRTAVWASQYGRELFRLDGTPEETALFQPAWYPAGHGRSGYLVQFVAERGESVWFGGTPFEEFTSAGLYRFDLAKHTCERFGPRDGFHAGQNHTINDGFWLGDRLWLATVDGLCAVTERK